jgi:hypothetical protein
MWSVAGHEAWSWTRQGVRAPGRGQTGKQVFFLGRRRAAGPGIALAMDLAALDGALVTVRATHQ